MGRCTVRQQSCDVANKNGWAGPRVAHAPPAPTHTQVDVQAVAQAAGISADVAHDIFQYWANRRRLCVNWHRPRLSLGWTGGTSTTDWTDGTDGPGRADAAAEGGHACYAG